MRNYCRVARCPCRSEGGLISTEETNTKSTMFLEGIGNLLKTFRSHLSKQQCTPVFNKSLFIPHCQLSKTYRTGPFMNGRISIFLYVVAFDFHVIFKCARIISAFIIIADLVQSSVCAFVKTLLNVQNFFLVCWHFVLFSLVQFSSVQLYGKYAIVIVCPDCGINYCTLQALNCFCFCFCCPLPVSAPAVVA